MDAGISRMPVYCESPPADTVRGLVQGCNARNPTRLVIGGSSGQPFTNLAPAKLLSGDPQLICYSWISGIPDVALVVFVRKHAPEIQYLKATISEEQRKEFGRLVESTINQLESGHFATHSGIRFPQNGCVSCPHLGLCLGNQQLIETNLIRRPGASDLDWLDDLVD
jgi:hypothetical protein